MKIGLDHRGFISKKSWVRGSISIISGPTPTPGWVQLCQADLSSQHQQQRRFARGVQLRAARAPQAAARGFVSASLWPGTSRRDCWTPTIQGGPLGERSRERSEMRRRSCHSQYRAALPIGRAIEGEMRRWSCHPRCRAALPVGERSKERCGAGVAQNTGRPFLQGTMRR